MVHSYTLPFMGFVMSDCRLSVIQIAVRGLIQARGLNQCFTFLNYGKS